MKFTGMSRKVDDMGRIVLPMELRRNMGIAEGTPLEISVDASGNIVLSPVASPMTEVELEKRIGKPVRVKAKSTGVRAWIVIKDIDSTEVYGTDGSCYTFKDNDFYDREVWA